MALIGGVTNLPCFLLNSIQILVDFTNIIFIQLILDK